MQKLDDTYRVCIVKRNTGKSVRLCDLNSLLRFVYTGEDDRTEIEITSSDGSEDFSNELWIKGSMIWFSPIHPKIIEATCEDKQAEKEDKLAREWIDKVPDIDPKNNQKQNGTLLEIIGSANVIEGQKRWRYIN